MLFNSFAFLVFFPIVIAGYAALNARSRVYWLLLASAYFYASFVPAYLLILVGVILVDYVAGLLLERTTGRRRRVVLMASLVANIGVLFIFKYFDFVSDSIDGILSWFDFSAESRPLKLGLILPIGLSFHVFQSLSYTIEVFLGRQRAERDLAVYSLYVLYFPQLVAGPIERPQNLLSQFHDLRALDASNLAPALRLIVAGLLKKCVVADNLTLIVDRVYETPEAFGGIALALSTIFFSIQIYCDFSGYSNIARGCSRLFGVELMVNFAFPYQSISLREFWQRWHRSLSTWFRDYVYIPLGGSQRGAILTYRNLLVVFMLSGVWHGANWTFIFWGLWHGVGLICEILVLSDRRDRVIQHRYLAQLITLVFVAFGWVAFRAKSMAEATYVYSHIFTEPTKGLSVFTTSLLATGVILCGALLYLERLHTRYDAWKVIAALPTPVRLIIYSSMALTFLVIGQFSRNQFIYFQF